MAVKNKIQISGDVIIDHDQYLITAKPDGVIKVSLSDIENEEKKPQTIKWVSHWFHGTPDVIKQDPQFHTEDKLSLLVKKVYSGGGLGWLEPFKDNEEPLCKLPHGYFFNCIGPRSVDKIEWREYQIDDNGPLVDLKEGKHYGQGVQLHIYTTGLYGQELQVYLKDVRKLNADLTVDTDFKDDSKDNIKEYFGAEVDVYIDEQGNEVQKAIITINIEHRWRVLASGWFSSYGLDIVCIIRTTLDNVDHGDFTGSKDSLKVEVPIRGTKIEAPEVVKSGNNPVVIGDIPTHTADFKPCFYTKIEIETGTEKSKTSYSLFDKQKAIDLTHKPIQILAGPHKLPISVNLPDLDIQDCLHIGKPLEHKGKVITVSGEPESSEIISINDNSIKLNQTYPSPSTFEFAKMAWLPNAVPIQYFIELNTCRYTKKLQVDVLPMLKYELFFKFMTENPYDMRATKAYVDKKYRGGKGLFTGKEKKKDRKKRKKDDKKAVKERREQYKEEKEEIAKEGSLFNFTNFEVGLEYCFGDEKEVGFVKNNIPIEGEGPVFNALETGMWVINQLSSLCFKKEAEEAEREAEELIENPKSVKDKKKAKQLKGRKKKRKNYLKKIGKEGKKVGKKMGKVLPFCIKIDQPVFAGAIAWQYAYSSKFPSQVGKEYTLQFKADPLIAIEGRLDLLFIATKIPYLGQAIKALTATADAIDSSDDFWNWLVETFGGDDDDKINIDVDYHVDLFVSGESKVEATATKYHTIDGFTSDDISVKCEFKFGIDCEISAKVETKKISSEAVIGGQAFAKFTVEKKSDTLECSYDGLFAVVYAKIKFDKDRKKGASRKNEGNEKPVNRFKIHDGFSFIKETKIT